MSNTKYVSAAVALFLLSAASALAVSDSAPNNPNSVPPRPYPTTVSYCQPGTAPVTSGGSVFCGGTAAGRFVKVDSVSTSYQGRVFRLSPTNGSGYQEFDW